METGIDSIRMLLAAKEECCSFWVMVRIQQTILSRRYERPITLIIPDNYLRNAIESHTTPYPSISQSMHFHYSHLSNMKYAKQTKPFTIQPECQLNLPASHEYSHTRFIRIQTQTRRRVIHSSSTQLLEASEKSS